MRQRDRKRERKLYLICWKAIVKLSVVIRALVVRAIFVAFIFLAVWNVVIVKANDFYWLLLGSAIPFGAEVLYACKVIFIEKKDSSKMGKWFSPVVLLFLCSACPTIWIIEMTIWSQSQVNNTTMRNLSSTSASLTSTAYPTNAPNTSTTYPANMVIFTLQFTIDFNQFKGVKKTIPSIASKPTTIHSSADPTSTATSVSTITTHRILNMLAASEMKAMIQEESPSSSNELMEQVEGVMKSVSPENRVRMMEQFLLLCLIFARWLLPRAGITRQQLSQLLLVNIGMGADILELFEAFKEPVVRKDFRLTMAILSLWQASLLQFCLIKTATKARKIRGGFSQTLQKAESISKLPGCLFCETELWAISTSVLLQDGPFLVLRLLLLFQYKAVSYSNIFFTTKNTLVIVLQLFRVGVILFEHRASDQLIDEEVSIHRSKRSVSILVENLQEGRGNSLSVYPATSIHSLFQKRYIQSPSPYQMPRCYSHSEVDSNPGRTLSSLV